MTALDHLMKLREENGELDKKTEIQFNNIVGILKEKNPGYRGRCYISMSEIDGGGRTWQTSNYLPLPLLLPLLFADIVPTVMCPKGCFF